jgi:hypothetical protein
MIMFLQGRGELVEVIVRCTSQFQAREWLEQEVTKQTGMDSGSRVMNDGSVTFGWFVRNRFFPVEGSELEARDGKGEKVDLSRRI